MFNVPCRMYVRSKHSPRLFFARLLTSTARCSEPVPSAHHTFQLALSCHHSPCPCPCPCHCPCSCSHTQGLLAQQLGEPQKQSKSMPVTPLLSILQYLPSVTLRLKSQPLTTVRQASGMQARPDRPPYPRLLPQGLPGLQPHWPPGRGLGRLLCALPGMFCLHISQGSSPPPPSPPLLGFCSPTAFLNTPLQPLPIYHPKSLPGITSYTCSSFVSLSPAPRPGPFIPQWLAQGSCSTHT